MEFLSTMALALAAFFGLSEVLTIFTAWSEGEDTLTTLLDTATTEYQAASALIASTTEALQQLASSTPLSR